MDAVNVLTGLLGALLGVAASLVISLADVRRRERAAIRAVYVEALTHETFLRPLAEEGTNAGPISQAIYTANLSHVASRLSKDEMTTVGAAYLFVPHCERLRQDYMQGRPLTMADRRIIATTHNSFLKATAILHRRSYGRALV